jgi:hypothetical protein
VLVSETAIGRLLSQDEGAELIQRFEREIPKKELGIESRRIGFGRGASYMWRVKPPAWTVDLGVHD